MKTSKNGIETPKQQLNISMDNIKECKLKSTNIKRVEACRKHKGLCVICKYYR
jgi:hypothetical protein